MGFSAFTGAIGTRTGVYREVWVDAGAMAPASTNGAEAETQEDGDVTLDLLKFDGTTAEFAHFKLRMPKSWDVGALRVILHWDAESGASPGDGVTWTVAATAASDGDSRSVSFTPVDISDSLNASGDVNITSAVEVSVAGTPQLNDQLFFRIGRDPTDGGDNMSEDARLMGVFVQWLESANEPKAL